MGQYCIKGDQEAGSLGFLMNPAGAFRNAFQFRHIHPGRLMLSNGWRVLPYLFFRTAGEMGPMFRPVWDLFSEVGFVAVRRWDARALPKVLAFWKDPSTYEEETQHVLEIATKDCSLNSFMSNGSSQFYLQLVEVMPIIQSDLATIFKTDANKLTISFLILVSHQQVLL